MQNTPEPVLAQPHQSLLLGQGLPPALPSTPFEFTGHLESGLLLKRLLK